jgi:hypothetical protein
MINFSTASVMGKLNTKTGTSGVDNDSTTKLMMTTTNHH